MGRSIHWWVSEIIAKISNRGTAVVREYDGADPSDAIDGEQWTRLDLGAPQKLRYKSAGTVHHVGEGLQATAMREEAGGYAGLDENGQIALSALPDHPGHYLGIVLITSGTTYTPSSSCRLAEARLIGGGGGGGAATQGGSGGADAGGGGSGSQAFYAFTVTPSTTYTVAIGAAGAAGTAGGSGGAGGDTTLTVGATTVTAPGGGGGTGMTAGTTAGTAAGGAAGALATNGAVNGAGSPGQAGLRQTAANGYAGAGAPGPFGGAGAGALTVAAGGPGLTFGSGGGGARATPSTSDQNGGAGYQGGIAIREYS